MFVGSYPAASGLAGMDFAATGLVFSVLLGLAAALQTGLAFDFGVMLHTVLFTVSVAAPGKMLVSVGHEFLS